MTRTPKELINTGMLTEAAGIMSETTLALMSPPHPAVVETPCQDPWERKWLQLDCWHPDVQRMATEVRRFSSRWFHNKPDGRLLVIAGHTGCGKTHALEKAFHYARTMGLGPCELGHWKAPPRLWQILWPEMAQSLSEAVTPAESIMRDALDSDLLFLDDIGAESDRFKSGHPTDCLCQLLTRRQGKFTFVTTNIGESEWHKRWDDVRIADRLHRNSIIVDMTQTGSYALSRA